MKIAVVADGATLPRPDSSDRGQIRLDAFELENVKHLTRHDTDNTFRIILQTLTDQL